MKTKKTNNNKKEGLLNRPEQSNTVNNTRLNYAKRAMYRSLDTEKLLVLLRYEAPKFFELAEVVGKWVWVQFEQKQPHQVTRVLSQLGFHWNKTRQTWQHPCGVECDKASPVDPRRKYGSYFPANAKAA
jgi:hypothetical protein